MLTLPTETLIVLVKVDSSTMIQLVFLVTINVELAKTLPLIAKVVLIPTDY